MKQERARVRALTVVFLFSAVAAEKAIAQEYKGEVYGNFGYGSVADDDYSLGNGVVVGGGFGYRFSRRWGFAVDFSRNAHSRDLSSEGIVNKWDGHSLILNGSMVCHFRPESRTRPYLRFGVSYARQEHNEFYQETPSVFLDPFMGSETREETLHATNDFVGLDLGFGVKIFVSERISIRPELRYATLSVIGDGGSPDVLWAPWFSVGIGYHW
jgi:opacity protein-like surface antigen